MSSYSSKVEKAHARCYPTQLIHLDVRQRILEIVGVKGERKTPEEMEAILAKRKKNWQPKPVKYKRGVLRLFSDLAASPMKGAYLEYEKG